MFSTFTPYNLFICLENSSYKVFSNFISFLSLTIPLLGSLKISNMNLLPDFFKSSDKTLKVFNNSGSEKVETSLSSNSEPISPMVLGTFANPKPVPGVILTPLEPYLVVNFLPK